MSLLVKYKHIKNYTNGETKVKSLGQKVSSVVELYIKVFIKVYIKVYIKYKVNNAKPSSSETRFSWIKCTAAST